MEAAMHIEPSKNKKTEGKPYPPLAHSIKETGELINLSRTSVYKLIADGTLRTIKLRNRRLVPATEINRILNPEK